MNLWSEAMTKFGVGDKVSLKGSGKFLGYVSHVDKGYLFKRKDYQIYVHIGYGEHIKYLASELQLSSYCECHDLQLPRWDIYICDHCKRKLVHLPMPVFNKKGWIKWITIGS